MRKVTKTKAIIKTSTVVAVGGAMMLAAAAAALTIRPNLLNIRFKPYSGDICRVPGYSTSGYIKVPCNNTCLVPGYNAPSGYIKVPCYTPTTPGYNTPTPGYNVPGYGR